MSNIFFKISKNNLFETITLIMIIWNSVLLALDDSTIDDCAKDPIYNFFDKIMIIFYTGEAVIKIFGQGLLLGNVK